VIILAILSDRAKSAAFGPNDRAFSRVRWTPCPQSTIGPPATHDGCSAGL